MLKVSKTVTYRLVGHKIPKCAFLALAQGEYLFQLGERDVDFEGFYALKAITHGYVSRVCHQDFDFEGDVLDCFDVSYHDMDCGETSNYRVVLKAGDDADIVCIAYKMRAGQRMMASLTCTWDAEVLDDYEIISLDDCGVADLDS